MMVLRAVNPWFRQQQEEEQRRPTTPTGLYVVMGEEMLLEEDLNHHHHSQNLLYNINMLKEKLHQVETLLLNNNLAPLSHGQEAAGIAAGIQDIMVTASSMLFSCQQMSLNAAAMIHNTTTNNNNSTHDSMQQDGNGFYVGKLEEETPVRRLLEEDGHTNKNDNNEVVVANGGISRSGGGGGGGGVSRSGFLSSSSSDYDIIEVGAGDLLAENSHYCHICGKGFKRDANLRMHMRAHGDEYKSNAALTKPPPPPPPRSSSSSASFEDYNSGQFLINLPRKYSCPEEGCRWNKKHAKFQPLKSMICVKNHYKRSHCPKMYVCNRCSRKKFSVLSDLRTHEKHCGDVKWRCSCGTTFSRKDKLLGHLALFVGHAPATHPIT